MRRLKLQMQVSVDGFCSTGPNDEQGWVTWAFDEIKPQVLELINGSDTLLIGRKLAVDYIPYWEDVFTQPDHEMHEISKFNTGAKKIVFSKTLDKAPWKNTEINKGDIAEEIKKLKNQSGKNIMVYGGATLVSNLIKEGLIDEYHFFVNPVVLGQGVPIFEQLKEHQQLVLKNSIVYKCGIVMLHYEPKS